MVDNQTTTFLLVFKLFPTKSLQKQHGVDWTIETLLSASDNSITVCCFAPLTNVAMAMIKAPEILTKINRIVMMGGGYFEGGNITPTAEFNIFVDPHAANIIIASGIPLTMMGLDVTHQVNVNKKNKQQTKEDKWQNTKERKQRNGIKETKAKERQQRN